MYSSAAENSWVFLYLENKSQIERFFRRRLTNIEDCKDLEQELYIRLHKLDPKKSVDDRRAYLFRIAQNLVNDLLRHKQRTLSHIDDKAQLDDIHQDTYQTDDQVSDRQRLKHLDQAIQELAPKCKEVFLLRKIDNIPNKEIATRLGISQNMVEKHLRKALKELRQYLDQKEKLN